MQTKLRLVFLMSLLIILPPIIYFHSWSNVTNATTPSTARSTTQARPRARPRADKTRVLIVAYGRSGSSFLGGIFNVHPEVFYIYEPLNPLAKIVTTSSPDVFLDQAAYVIHSIVTCGFSDGRYLEKLSWFSHIRASSRPLVSTPFCMTTRESAINFATLSRWNVCARTIDAHALNAVCRKYSHVITKILLERLQPAGLSWALHVSGASRSFPVHILYLVRDPRAMFFSRYKLGWFVPQIRRAHSLVSGEAEDIVERHCEQVERNLAEIVREQDRMELVRYEDLATEPEAVTARLFEVLRISPHEDVLRWIKDKTRAPLDRSAFSLSRHGKVVLNAWRKQIPIRLLSIVEEKCERVMRYLGYVPTHGSTPLLGDLDKALFLKRMPKLEMSLGRT